MSANPGLVDYYNGMPKETLVRKLCLTKMNQAETQTRRMAPYLEWAKAHPEVQAKIDKAIAQKPAQHHQSIAASIARSEAAKMQVKVPGAKQTA